jgi:hypothetical protein
MVPNWLELLKAKTPKSESALSTTSGTRTSAPVSTASARTTNSNPVAIKVEAQPKAKPKPKAPAQQAPPINTESYSDDLGFGIPETFEKGEREAALSSPLKGSDVRLSQSVCIAPFLLASHVSDIFIIGYHFY